MSLSENVVLWLSTTLPQSDISHPDASKAWWVWRVLEHFHARLEPQSLPVVLVPTLTPPATLWSRTSDLLLYFGLAVTVEAWLQVLHPPTPNEGEHAIAQLLTVLHQHFTADAPELRFDDAQAPLNGHTAKTFVLSEYLFDVAGDISRLQRSMPLCVSLCGSKDDVRSVCKALTQCLSTATPTTRPIVLKAFVSFFHELLPTGRVELLTEWFLDYGGGMDALLPFLSEQKCTTEEVALVSHLVCVVVAPGAALQRRLLEEELLGRLSSDTELYLRVIATLSEHSALHPTALSCAMSYTLHLLTTRLTHAVAHMALHVALGFQVQLKDSPMWLEIILQHMHRALGRPETSATQVTSLCGGLLTVLTEIPTTGTRPLYTSVMAFFGTSLRCVFSCSLSRRTLLVMLCDALLKVSDLPLGEFFVSFDDCITAQPTIFALLTLVEVQALCQLCKHPRLFCYNAEVEVLCSILIRLVQHQLLFTTTVMVSLCVLSLRLESDPLYLSHLEHVIYECARHALSHKSLVHLLVRKIFALGSVQLSRCVVDGCTRLQHDAVFEGKKRNIVRFNTACPYGPYVMEMLTALGIKLVAPELKQEHVAPEALPPLVRGVANNRKSPSPAAPSQEQRQRSLWVRLTIVEEILDRVLSVVTQKENLAHHTRLVKLSPLNYREGKSKAHSQARLDALRVSPSAQLPKLTEDDMVEIPMKKKKTPPTFVIPPGDVYPFVHMNSRITTVSFLGATGTWSSERRGNAMGLSEDSATAGGGQSQSVMGRAGLTGKGSFVVSFHKGGERGESLGGGHYVGVASGAFTDYGARYDVVRDATDRVWAVQDVSDEDDMATVKATPSSGNALGRVFGHLDRVRVSWDRSTGEVWVDCVASKAPTFVMSLTSDVALYPFAHLDSASHTSVTFLDGTGRWSAVRKGPGVALTDHATAAAGASQNVMGDALAQKGSFVVAFQRTRGGLRGESLGGGHYVGVASGAFTDYGARYDVVRDATDRVWAVQDVSDEDDMATVKATPSSGNALGRVFGHLDRVRVSWDRSTGEVWVDREAPPVVPPPKQVS